MEAVKHQRYLSYHRFYELKHFCMQYQTWKRVILHAGESKIKTAYANNIDMIEQSADRACGLMAEGILKAVTEGLSYSELKVKMVFNFSPEEYYEAYRRFFWVLNGLRN
jgi:hypothetical protein